MPKFSIITPSYNSWSYMDPFLESLEKQTFQDFEVLIIDDCSKDDTYSMLSEYVKKSPLDIHISKNEKNSGPGYSRNRGIAEAKGEWITFIDSDDYVDVRYLEKASELIDSNQRAAVPINCIICDYYSVTEKKETRMDSYYGNVRGGIHPVPFSVAMVRNHTFGKFYRADKIRSLRFPELKRCEDVAFVCQAIDACCMSGDRQVGSVYYLKEPLYYYIQRPSSLSNDASLDSRDMLEAYKVINRTIGKKYRREICAKSVPDLLYGGTLMMCKARKKNSAIRRYIQAYERHYPDWYSTAIVKKLGKAKLAFLIFAKQKNIPAMKALAYIHSRMIGRK